MTESGSLPSLLGQKVFDDLLRSHEQGLSNDLTASLLSEGDSKPMTDSNASYNSLSALQNLSATPVSKRNIGPPTVLGSVRTVCDKIWRSHLRYAVFGAIIVFVMLSTLQPPLIQNKEHNKDWRLIFLYTVFVFVFVLLFPTLLSLSGYIANICMKAFM